MAKIGVLGGSFHPFHIGHLQLGQYCLENHIVDEVWFIPTGISYLKKNINMLSGEDRLHLLELGIQGMSNMRALDIEIKREGNTYTYETLEELKENFPEHEFFFIIGADCLFTIEKWFHAERIFAASTLLAAKRDGKTQKAMKAKALELKERYNAKIKLIDFPEMNISSTEIRERIKAGKDIVDLVPKLEAQEIIQKGYFKSV